jgi:hypothetical protein
MYIDRSSSLICNSAVSVTARAIVGLGIGMMSGIQDADFWKKLLQATKDFGDVLYPFLSNMAHASSPEENLVPVQKACIAHNGKLRPLYEYIHCVQQPDTM